MLAAPAMTAFGMVATIAIAGGVAQSRSIDDLVEHGFELVARGELFHHFECTPASVPITVDEIRRGNACESGRPVYGSFKRLRKNADEFVCVSFRNWSCYQALSEQEVRQ
jgi:hypothetical protein